MTWLTDDTVLMMQKCTQIKWHCVHKSKSNSRFVELFGDTFARKTLISLIFIQVSDITKTKRRSKRYEEPTHALLWFGFFQLYDKMTNKQKHVHNRTHTPQRSCWKIASICKRIVHIHHCMGYKYKYKYMCIHIQRATKSSVACVQCIQVWIYMSPNQSHHILC